MIQGLKQPGDRRAGLHISSSTVKNHVSSVLDKLGTTSRTQAAAPAVEHVIVDGKRMRANRF
ncbi:MAG: response regulator transcription factor [Chloroflexi bacterium]|nr:response regulator transcription factor [Chloroflexota bacterium]